MPTQEKKQCHFCVNDIDFIDWKDHKTLRNFLTHQYKIAPRAKTGVCAKHHRRLSRAIKRARIAALIPFTPRRR